MKRIKKSLQIKVILIMVSLFMVTGLVDFLVKEQIIYSSFFKIEQQEANKNLQRVKRAIDGQLQNLANNAGDWSSWTDMYEYVQNPSKEFELSNLIDDTFSNYEIQLIFIINDKNDVVWGKVFAPDFKHEIELLAFNKIKLPASHPALQLVSAEKSIKASIAGIISTEYGPMLIASRNIIRSDNTGPSKGAFIMGKFLTKKSLEKLKEQVQIPFELVLPDDTHLPNKFQSIKTNLDKNNGSYIETLPKNLLAYIGYSDFSSKTAFIIETHFPREITEKGEAALRISSIIMIATSFILLLIVQFFLRKSILNPILLMTNFLLKLKLKRDFNSRVSIKRSDEIGVLANGLDDMCRTIAEQTNLLTEINFKLELASSTDALTGIANRRTFDLVYSNCWKLHFREQKSFALIIADIDCFKLYNDTYGHQKGDECLKAVAKNIHQSLQRETDLAARYGGEEFIVILPNTGIEGAKKVAEMIRESVENLAIPHPNSTAADVVTISLGGGVIIPSKDMSAADFFDTVDQMLYKSKERGRNQINIMQVENQE